MAAVAVAVLIAGWNVAGMVSPSTVLLAAAALAVASLAVLAARHQTEQAGPRAPARRLTLRDRVHNAIFVRLRDPGAPGRPRPRTPSARLRAAPPGLSGPA